MKKSASVIAILCAAFMTATALTACGGDNTPANSDATSAVDSTDANGSDDATEAETEAEKSAEPVKSQPLDAADIPSGTPSDFGWVKFEMPEGYSVDDTVDSDSWIRLKSADDDFLTLDIKHSSSSYSGDIQEPADDRLRLYGEQGTDFTLGSFTYRPVFYQEGFSDAVVLFAPINDKEYLEIQGIRVTEKDAAMCTILNTIEVDETQLD